MRRLLAIAVVLMAFPCLASAAAPRTITLVNHTDQTIWPAASPGSILGQSGWTLKPGAEVSFQVPHDWNARLWGRTGCHFGSGGGEGHCRTGDCDDRYQCTGWGSIPATLGEFNFDAYKGLDFYDISMVDGSNLPMYATPSGGEAARKVDLDGCLIATKCTTEVHCPVALRVPRRGGPEVGCISPCARFGTDRYCCRGPFAAGCSPAKTWPVDYARVFKRAEPYAYSWSDDDATSVFTCKGSCDYTITFGLTPPDHGAAVGSSPRSAAARAGPKTPLRERHNVPFPAITEMSFRARAGHGYELTGTGRRVDYSEAELEKFSEDTPSSYSTFFLKLTRGDGEALYMPQATLAGGDLEARLGKLGIVSLRFIPHRVEFHPPYKRCRGERTRIEHGVFIGRLRFDGERGYARVLRRSIPGTLTRQRPWRCDLTPTPGAPKGTRVGGVALAHGGRSSVAFTAERTSPTGAGTLTAFMTEQRGHLSIERTVDVEAAAGSVEIENDLSGATIKPPAPFSGTATFTADPGKQSGSWLGDLSVSFPGRPDVRLAGARFEGSLLKPGQCSVKGNVICVAFGRPELSPGGG